MRLDTIFLITGILLLVIFFSIKNRKKKLLLILPGFGIVFLFAPSFLPNILFGKWDAIKEVENKEIRSIILQPSQPKYKCNLVDTTVKIENKDKVEYLLNLLRNTEIYSPNHGLGTWEVNLILVKVDTDSLLIKIEKLENGETVIYSKRGNYKKDGLAEYLEAIVNFSLPVKGK